MKNEQKVAIITGASQGIGAGLVKAYRDRNYRVVATSRSIGPSTDPNVLNIAGDIGDPSTGKFVVDEGLAQFGRIDTLVNNAGVFLAGPFDRYTDEQYRKMLSTNLNGFFYVTRKCDPRDGEAG
jgi:NAD(P)-dependent dehydrogenase (short-subunit alcohol dehydrogenase family)